MKEPEEYPDLDLDNTEWDGWTVIVEEEYTDSDYDY
jgi:hypothetical protein